MTSRYPPVSDALAEAERRLSEQLAALGAEMGSASYRPVPNSYDEALERAALRGAFALDRLTDFAPEEERLALRSALSRVSEPVRETPPRLHSLTRDQRQATLERLLLEPARLHARLDEGTFPRGDGVGQALRHLLRVRVGAATPPDLGQIESARLEDLMVAAGWMEPLGSPVAPVAIRTEIASRSMDEWIEKLLPDGLVGRDDLLARIESFALTEPMSGSGILVLDGIGGVGKSALVAEAIRRLRRQGLPVFYFDLDRPALDPRNSGFTLEFLRQLAVLAPGRAEDLKEIRKRLRRTFEGTARLGLEYAAWSKYRAEDDVSYEIRAIVTEAGLGAQPLCLFIDTFEVAMARGAAAVELVRDWVHTARRAFGAENLLAVIAGRAASDAAGALDASEVLPIPDLSLPDAVEVLRRLDVDAGAAVRLAKVFGGNPLVLRLVARFLRNNPHVSIDDLTAPGGVPEADAEIVQGVLYQRILGHIGEGPDDSLRRIAYPGLALRVVTPALIRDVLGPVLGIDLDQAAVWDLWGRLLDQAWLVSLRGPEVAEHRRDLRRMMVRVMVRDRDNEAILKELHRRSAAYHETGRDPHLTLGEARAEALYHRLMLLETGEELKLDDPNAISLAVGNDIDDLPPPAQALVKFHLTSFGRITPEDAALLPERLGRPWSVREGWTLLDENSLEEALQLAIALRGRVNAARPPVWELTAIHRTAAWDDPATEPRVAAAERALADEAYGDTAWLDESNRPREEALPALAATSLLLFEREEWSDSIDWPGYLRGSDHFDATDDISLRSVIDTMTLRQMSLALIGPGPRARERLRPFRHLAFQSSAARTYANAIVRLSALTPAAVPSSDQRFQLQPEMLLPTPAGREKLVRLKALLDGREAQTEPGHLQPSPRIPPLSGDPRRPLTSGELLGSIATTLAGAFQGRTLTLGDLLAAGMTPNEIVAGLHHEQPPVARHVLSRALLDDGALARFAERLPGRLGERQTDGSLFLPADFAPDEWLRAARESRDRTFSNLVLWAQRAMVLDTVVVLAREEAGSGDGSLGRLARSLSRWKAAFEEPSRRKAAAFEERASKFQSDRGAGTGPVRNGGASLL